MEVGESSNDWHVLLRHRQGVQAIPQKADNQNYSLRLAKLGSSAGITFYFGTPKFR